MRTLALSLLAIVLLLQYHLWVSDGGMREVWRLRHEVAAQTEVNAQLKDRNRTLAAEVQDLKKGKSAVEERARTDLGMVGANETFFQVAPLTLEVAKPSTLIARQTPAPADTDSESDAQSRLKAQNKLDTARPLVSVQAGGP